jgi:hypothetical protein
MPKELASAEMVCATHPKPLSQLQGQVVIDRKSTGIRRHGPGVAALVGRLMKVVEAESG